MEKEKYYSGAPWEKSVSYSRITKVGSLIFVSGTTAVDDTGKIVGEGNVYEQAKYIFNKIEKGLQSVGASLSDVVRTRTFMINLDDFHKFALAHSETFGGIDPAATCVEITRLVDDKLLLEIEVDAVTGQA